MRKILYVLLPIFLVLSSCKKGTESAKEEKNGETAMIIDGEAKARLDSTLKEFVTSGQVAGVSALIFEKDKEAYFNAFGYSDREAKIAMDRNTIVQIFSMTKPITGTALMTLYEKGAFQLDDSLSKYAPEFSKMKVFVKANPSGKITTEPARRPITIRDITRHTAGFVNSPDVKGMEQLIKTANATDRHNTLTQMAQKLGSLPLMFHPGDEWSYGPSVDVQAFLVERISGNPFDQYLRETVFEPLGMKNTGYLVPEGERQRFAAMYRRNDTLPLTRMPDSSAKAFNTKDWPLKPGGFGLTSTIDDYMRFARMLVNKGSFNNATILKPETVELMATSHLSDTITKRMWLGNKGQVGFGIDFAVRVRPPADKEENNGVVGEFFWDGAASTLFWVDPVNKLTAVLFVQIMPFDGKLHKKFRDAVYGPYDSQNLAGK